MVGIESRRGKDKKMNRVTEFCCWQYQHTYFENDEGTFRMMAETPERKELSKNTSSITSTCGWPCCTLVY